jgi:hypothetical protein
MDCRGVRGEMRKTPADGPPQSDSRAIKETVMQDAHCSGWHRESPVSDGMLGSLRELNHRFLDLAGACSGDWICGGREALPPELANRVAPLSAAQRSAAASCPYALFDLHFHDEAHWRPRLQPGGGPWRIADEAACDRATYDFVQLALIYAWHLASTAKLSAQFILGMSERTADDFGRLTVNHLPALAAAEAANLSARWRDCGAYWRALVLAASRPDAAGLRRVQLYGLQLAAAARLH